MGYDQGGVSTAELGRPGHSREFWSVADGVLGTGGTLMAAYDQIPVIRFRESRQARMPPQTASATPAGSRAPEAGDPLAALLRDRDVKFVTVGEIAELTRTPANVIYRLIRDCLNHGAQDR
jgi:hypothetical protein